MFDYPQTANLGQNQLEKEPCRPDPEQMLQNARKQREKIECDLAAFESMDNYYFPNHEETVLLFYGSIHCALYSAKQAEEYWLEQCNGGDE